MEQLNYSFFLLVLGDRLLKTDGRRSVHSLAGEAGCSRSAGGRADSCLVAFRHPGNCLSPPNVYRGLVTLWHSDAFSWGSTMSHTGAHKILHSLHASDLCKCAVTQAWLLKKSKCIKRFPSPIALLQPFKIGIIVVSFAATGFFPSCKLSEATRLEGGIACSWQGSQQDRRQHLQSPA